MINPNIFRDYDIRGVIGRDMDPADAEVIGRSFGTYIQETSGRNILVGRDNRFSSDALEAYFIQGTLSTGCNVVDTELSLRPIIQMGVLKEGFDGGALITGSHNPPEYNGFKLLTKSGAPVFGPEIGKLKNLLHSGKFLRGKGSIGYANLSGLYFKEALKPFSLDTYLKVVVDTGNGTASKFAPEFMRRLGTKVISLYGNLNGSYPYHTPNPEARVNTLDLTNTVLKEKADLGVAFDTDGDRFGIVDEKGQFHENDTTVVLLARELLQKHPGAKIIFDIKSSYVLEKEIEKAGGIPIMMQTGHPYFQERMKDDPQILLGGELSGHTMFQEHYCFDDGLFAAAKVIELLSRTQKPLSELYQGIPQTAHTPEIKAPCHDEEKFKIAEEIQQIYQKDYPIKEMSGARIIFSETAWALIRASNTTPCLSLRFEAENKKVLIKIMRDVKTKLEKYPQVDLSQLNQFLEVGNNL